MASGFDTLPDELLIEIFSKCLPPNRWDITPNPSEAPTSLTLVCKRWRSVALGVPSLWSWMRVRLSRDPWQRRNREAVRRISSQIGNVLGRSKPGPINFMLSTANYSNLPPVVSPRFLSDLLAPICPPLTRLVLHRVPITQMRSIPQGLFPSLQSFVYLHHVRLRANSEERPVMAFADAPSLRRVALDTVFFSTGSSVFTLPWNQLTHFRSFDISQPCGALLSHSLVTQSPNLQWLGFDIQDKDICTPIVENVVRAIVMEGITTLSLDFERCLESGELEYPDAFQKVEFPNLRTLRLSALEVLDDVEDFLEELLLVLETFKKLAFLSLHAKSVDSNGLKTLFEHVPTIRTLHLSTHASESYSSTFQLLEAEDLLPHLDTLVLDLGFGQDQEAVANKIPASMLSRLLNSRKAGTHPTSHIRRIVVWGSEPVDLDDSQAFVGAIHRFMEENGEFEFVFDRRLGKTGERTATMWMEMDPGSCGWEEAVVAEKLWSALHSGYSSSVEDEDSDDTSTSDTDSDGEL